MRYLRTTIVFPRQDDLILLGMKKRGMGEGWWNGFGGKLLPGESYKDSAKRETMEEVGLQIGNLKHVANLHFYFNGSMDVVSRVYVANFSGHPGESEEMRPKFFSVNELPFDQMWPADRKWVPKVLGNIEQPLGFIIHFNKDKTFKSLKQVDYRLLEDKF